ncbi:uncharacterized protein THITE_162666 [Thermothielavioides terrestris NRRL 8126]|uniref:Uncharacterized protein n=1 Tax=Thermothielavioides terrestris (strain ATCC 38088 / NRRL 8126) TaxID=578455 RepID=G2QVP5_THETT|nr:uncharacterized protein THITE_162666 [Thermothielavioides terrestris NRRL 8126]AEO63026.1 hypothetical protein THITE_162666 [Thermothielavioides terrestris NRRL 8126]
MPFEPPKITDKKNAIWIEIAKPGFRDPRYLWSDYWRRFNTITIPLLDEDAYFADALTAAKEAQSRQHLEELLAKRFEARRKELEQTVRDIFYASFSPRTPFPSEAARTAASKVGTTGSLDSFIQSVCGVVWGWGERSNEHEALQIHPADGHDSGDSGGSTEGDGERQHSDFSFSGNDVGSETQQWPEYPKFVHDDEADLLWNGIPSAWRVLECEDAEETPLERQLPSPTLPKDNAVLAVKDPGQSACKRDSQPVVRKPSAKAGNLARSDRR